MKTSILLSCVLIPLVFLSSCSDRGATGPTGVNPERGRLDLLFSKAPAEITSVVATLSRQGFETRTLVLTIADSMQTATGSFTEVATGAWHLRVEALSDTTVRYRGETDVEVRGGETAHVTLQLLPVSGNIQITVTWGTPNPGSGLMAYYPLNGDATDMSGNGNNGVVSGAVPTANRFGLPHSAMWFDGINDKITIASSVSLHPLHQMTIAFWMRMDSMQNNYLSILTKSNPVDPLSHREYRVDLKRGGDYYFQVHSSGDGSGQHTVFSNNLSGHPWLFFTAVIDRQNHFMKTYVNGVPNMQVDDGYSSFNANNDPLLIAMENETWPDHSPFLGALDEIRLYNRALTDAEILALYDMN